MNAVDETTATAAGEQVVPRSEVYETWAEIETALGYDAWNAGDYHRAIELWLSAARWSQFAAAAAACGVTP